jgi:hypothetical protein
MFYFYFTTCLGPAGRNTVELLLLKFILLEIEVTKSIGRLIKQYRTRLPFCKKLL